MTTLVWLANEALLLTNLFIYAYKVLLKLLNRLFPPVINTDFFPRKLFSPEPFEIPLFLILTMICVIIIVSNSLDFLTLKTSPKRKIYFIILLLSFVLNIGTYPMRNSVQFIHSPLNLLTSVIIVVIYLTAILAILFVVRRLKHRQLLVSVLILTVLAILSFEPGFPSEPHDTSYFLGPIFEIAKGKTIFTETSSQYGFLSIIILGFLTKLHLFNPFYLPFLTWILYIVQYFLCFYIIYKSSRSIVFALIGLFSILTINYFSLFHLPNTYPQIGPLRWLPLIISLFLVQKYKDITNFKLIFLLSLLSLWNVEAGIALFLTFGVTALLLTFARTINIKRLILSFIFFAFSTITVLIFLNAIHFASGKQLIDLLGTFTRLRDFAISGIAMIPMPWRTHFWLVILVYFATIIYVFRTAKIINHNQQDTRYKWFDKLTILSQAEGQNSNYKNQKSNVFVNLKFWIWDFIGNCLPAGKAGKLEIGNSENNLLLFSANLSLFASVYYIGRSHPHNLFHISLFFLLNTFIFIGLIKNEFVKISQNMRSYFIFYILFFIFFIVYPGYNRKQAIASMIKTKFDRLVKGYVFSPELEQQIKRYYFIESLLIKENLPQEEIIILSVDDTYLFQLVGKKNLLLDNPQSGIASKANLKMALKRALNICPKKIAATCSQFDLCPMYKTFNHELVNIQKILLESLEKSCKVKYKPIKCTNKLCISAWN